MIWLVLHNYICRSLFDLILCETSYYWPHAEVEQVKTELHDCGSFLLQMMKVKMKLTMTTMILSLCGTS